MQDNWDKIFAQMSLFLVDQVASIGISTWHCGLLWRGHNVSRDLGDGDMLGDVAFLKLDLDMHNILQYSLHWES